MGRRGGQGGFGIPRRPLGGLQTPTGTTNRDFGAFREASRHRQARQIVTCEPPRHQQGRWIVHRGASRGSQAASETPTGPKNLDFANSESLQEPPRSSKMNLWSSRTRQEAIRQPTWSLCQAPREPKEIPTSLQRRYHQGASGGMRGAVGILLLLLLLLSSIANIIIILTAPRIPPRAPW